MKVGDLVKWTPNEDQGSHPVYGIVTMIHVNHHYFDVSWMDGDSGTYSTAAIGNTMEKVDESRRFGKA